MKFKNILLICLVFICATILTSCNKKNKNLDYMYVGAYLDIIDVEEISFKDRNIKLYINPNKNNTLVNDNKIYEYQVSGEQVSHNVLKQSDYTLFSLSGSYTISDNYKDKYIEVYPVILEDGEYKVLYNDSKTIELKDDTYQGVVINKEYMYNDTKYKFTVSIQVKKEG